MNTKKLMIASSLFLGILGVLLTFLTQEIAEIIHFKSGKISFLILQILGSAYLGLAILNWMTKNNLIGGIYSRPLLIGNLIHFLVSSFALFRMIKHSENLLLMCVSLTIIYTFFTLAFSYVFITNPSKV